MRERVGMLLTKQERMKYADEIETECHNENRSIDPAITKMMQELGLSTTIGEFKDCWWKGLENESVLKFLKPPRPAFSQSTRTWDMGNLDIDFNHSILIF